MTNALGFAGVQMEVVPGDRNIGRMADYLEAIQRDCPWVELVLFSEMCVFGSDPRWAQRIPGEATERLCRLARQFQLWLVPGSLCEPGPGGFFNSAPVINPQGDIVAVYRKIYPWRPRETSLAGREFCVFDIPGRGRLGLCICYDQWFPEMTRQLVWMGAEIILNPVMTTTADRPLELVLSQANAIFNQVYFLSINGLGHGGNGRSILVDPEGGVIATAGEQEATLTARLDLQRVARVREKGTVGECQVLKSFRDGGVSFPVYAQGAAAGEGLKGLGPILQSRR
jgi:predicted amidohydrolase